MAQRKRTYRYAFQIETYNSRTDTYRRGSWSTPAEYSSDWEAAAAASSWAVGTASVTRVYIQRDDGVSWHIG